MGEGPGEEGRGSRQQDQRTGRSTEGANRRPNGRSRPDEEIGARGRWQGGRGRASQAPSLPKLNIPGVELASPFQDGSREEAWTTAFGTSISPDHLLWIIHSSVCGLRTGPAYGHPQ